MYCPGYIHPADEDGKCRAQKVTSNGYVTDMKNEYFDSKNNIPEDEKDKSQVATLKKHNAKFGFSFM